MGVLETVQRRPNIVGYAVGLETLAATAWFHNKADTRGLELDPFLNAVREFATNAYLPALYAGQALPPTRRDQVAQELSRFTGLAPQTWVDHDLQITKEEFRHLLFADRGLVMGLYDTRYLGPASGEDPALSGIEEASQWGIAASCGTISNTGEANHYRLFDIPAPVRWTYAPVSIAPTSADDLRALDYPADLLEIMQRRNRPAGPHLWGLLRHRRIRRCRRISVAP